MSAADRPPIPLDRPLEDDELAALLASVLLNPLMNPTLDWLAIGEFAAKAMWMKTNQPSPDQGKFSAANGGSNVLNDRVHALCWDWFRAGFLIPAGESRFRLSPRGKEAITGIEDDGRVLDRSWFGDRLGAISGPQRDIAIACATEGHEAMLAGLYRSAAVMIGVASEALVFALAEELRTRRVLLQLPKLSAKASALETLKWEASAFRDRKPQIKQQLANGDLSAKWLDDLPGLLAEGNAIRLLRNESGHPTPGEIGRRQIIGLFVLFPLMAEALSATADTIAKLPIDTK